MKQIQPIDRNKYVYKHDYNKVVDLMNDTLPYLMHWAMCTYYDTSVCKCGLDKLIERMKKITIK